MRISRRSGTQRPVGEPTTRIVGHRPPTNEDKVLGCSRLCLHSVEEDGFTLIELLMVILIIPIIMGAVAAVLITSLKDETGVSTRIADSSDAQVTSVLFVRDVQSAADVTTDSALTTTCGAPGTGTTFLLGLGWNSLQMTVSYRLLPSTKTASGTQLYEVERQFCQGGSQTPTSTVIVLHDASSFQGDAIITPAIFQTYAASGWTPTFAETTIAAGSNFKELPQPTIDVASTVGFNMASTTNPIDIVVSTSSGPADVTCTGTLTASFTGCTGGAGTLETGYTVAEALSISGITLSVNEAASALQGPLNEQSPGAFIFSVQAEPRSWNSGASNLPVGGSGPPFLMLGTGQVLTIHTGSSLEVNGVVAFNNATISCSGGTITATGVETTDSPASGAGSTCASDPDVTPAPSQWTTSATSFSDPYCPTGPPSCSGGLTDPSAEAVVPTSDYSSLNSGTVTLPPGQYTQPVMVNGATVILSGGIYEFDQGVSVSSGSLCSAATTQCSASGGTGVLIYIPCGPTGSYPADSWATKCNGQVDLNSSNGTVDLQPMSTGPYADIWLWQNGGDNQSININGPGSVNSYGGVLYAPTATVTLSGPNPLTVGKVIAASAILNNTTVCVLNGLTTCP